jgi:hypothetical protein
MRVAVLLVLLCAGRARAELAPPRTVVSGGTSLTTQTMGRLRVSGIGLTGDVSYRLGPVALAADAAVLWTSTLVAPEPRANGWMHRGGASLRWVAASLEPERGGGIDALELRLDAGVGVQSIGYDGGRLTRPDAWLGTGFQVRAHGEPVRSQFIFHFGFRLGFAQPYEVGEVQRMICSGSCTVDRGFSALDASWSLVIGAAWAR